MHNRPTGATDPSGLEGVTGNGREEGIVLRLIDGGKFVEHLKREQAFAAGFDKEYRDIIQQAHDLLVKHSRNPELARIAVDTLAKTRLQALAGKIHQHYRTQPPVGQLVHNIQMGQVQPRQTHHWADQAHTGASLEQFARSDAQAADRKATEKAIAYVGQLKEQAGWTAGERRHLDAFDQTAGMILDMIPGITAAKGVIESFRKGDYFDGVLYAALGAADIGLAVWVPARAAKAAKGVAPASGVRATGQAGSHFQPPANLINRANAVSETNMQHLLERVASEMNLPSDVRLIYNNVNPNSFARMGEGAYVLMEAVPARTGTGITIFVDSSVVYPQLVNAQQLTALPLRSRIQALLAHETTEIAMARFYGLELGMVSHGQAVANAPFNTLNMSQGARLYLGRWSRAGNVPAP